jgi:hypothetical protein
MRVVGPRGDQDEIELDPVRAFQRGRALDAMLRGAVTPPPRGAFRGSFEHFAREDARRWLEAARQINAA